MFIGTANVQHALGPFSAVSRYSTHTRQTDSYILRRCEHQTTIVHSQTAAEKADGISAQAVGITHVVLASVASSLPVINGCSWPATHYSRQVLSMLNACLPLKRL